MQLDAEKCNVAGRLPSSAPKPRLQPCRATHITTVLITLITLIEARESVLNDLQHTCLHMLVPTLWGCNIKGTAAHGR